MEGGVSVSEVTPPLNVTQLNARLAQVATELGIPVARARVMLCTLIVSQMLPNAVAVKGGMGVKLRFGERGTRATSDLDVSTRVRGEEFEQAFRARLVEGWGTVPASVSGICNPSSSSIWSIKLRRRFTLPQIPTTCDLMTWSTCSCYGTSGPTYRACTASVFAPSTRDGSKSGRHSRCARWAAGNSRTLTRGQKLRSVARLPSCPTSPRRVIGWRRSSSS